MPFGWMAFCGAVFRKQTWFTLLITAFAKIADQYALAQAYELAAKTVDSGQAHFFRWSRRHD